VLLQLFAHFRVRADHRAAYLSFCEQGGDALRTYAACEARKLRSHADAAVGMEFQIYVQWVAATQLAAAAAAARDAGMAIGLYRDLAVGAAHDSAETAANPALFARGMSVGAPPDMLNRQGQNWGLPPWNPRELARQGYAPLRRLLAANMRDAGALRIDHVMALTRLFWIPAGMSGADGGYVRNHFAALAAIVALESVRQRCMVIGEDLGAVPGGLREALGERGFLSYRVLIYERHWGGDGRFCAPHEYPRQALAMVATHDMPPLHEYWQGGDIERRAALGLFPDQQHADDEARRRDAERGGLLRLLGDCALSPANADDAGEVTAGLHGVIARSNAMLAAVQLDDLCGETTPVNIPGTYREYPNWRRKLSLTLEDIEAHQRWAQLADLMRAAGRV
jgi:4-alpha-glucanotransferase